MRVIDVRVMRGPNSWSTYRNNLVVMKVDLEDLEDCPTDLLNSFSERLKQVMPTLAGHRCTEGKPGGLFEKLDQGTNMAHVIEHIAIELQSLAGMPCSFGRTRSTAEKGVYHVVFDYELEEAGKYAAYAATSIVLKLASDVYCDITKEIDELVAINEREGLGPSTKALVVEATQRGIPWKRLDKFSTIRFGQGKNQKIVCATIASTTGSIGVDTAGDKQTTKEILEQGYIPVAAGRIARSEDEVREAIKEIGFPLVVKPVNGNHGRAVKINLNSAGEVLEQARKKYDDILIERFIEGFDHRFLLVNYKVIAVARRIPACIKGDGHSTIQALIDEVNSDPRRGKGHEKILTTIKVDEITHSILQEKKLQLDSVLPKGEILYLKHAANISAGGTAEDVTGIVHPHNLFIAERAARLVGLDICGIDIIAKDITVPIGGDNGFVLEVNAAPGFRMHLAPTSGEPRNVAAPVLNMLFPNGAASRIPVVAVTGTNGKTTTTKLIAHLARAAGHTVGYTSTDGIFIGEQRVCSGDCSGPSSAELILRDPIVDFAVFECARGGILRSGLGFDKSNISIITNIAEDHLGLDGIDSLAQLAKVKAVVAQSTFDHGFAILNADDELVRNIAKDLHCQVALFSTSANNPHIQHHCREGGWAAIIDEGYFIICKGILRTRVGKISDIPLTLDGRAQCMIRNILPSILSMAIIGIDINVIRQALLTFIPGPKNTPGRMNIFRVGNKEVMIDYAHNPHGFRELEEFMQNVNTGPKIGIITSPGDRRDEDIIKVGMLSARIFDEIIIRHDADCRGRTKQEISELTRKGICCVNPGMRVQEVSDEREAIVFAIKTAPEGAFIVACIDEVEKTVQFMEDIVRYGLPVSSSSAKVFSITQNNEGQGLVVNEGRG
jgi:cyanophycin synthetase